jgi:hypothetical protein
MKAPAFDAARYAEVMAAALDLPLPEAYRPGVEANLAIAHRLAGVLLEFPLPDEAEPAPIFDPLEPRP